MSNIVSGDKVEHIDDPGPVGTACIRKVRSFPHGTASAYAVWLVLWEKHEDDLFPRCNWHTEETLRRV